MGYENLGYLLIGAGVAVGALVFAVARRSGSNLARSAGFVVIFVGLVALLLWGIRVGAVRTELSRARRQILIYGSEDPFPQGFGDPTREEHNRKARRDLAAARAKARAYGWKWEDL